MSNIQSIQPSSLAFLKLLKENNEREWFNANKTTFQKEQVLIETFAQHLLDLMNTHDVIETPSGKKSLYRIYRDTRFSTDKTPYKTHWSGSFKRAGKSRRGGYYFHIEPGNSFVAGGFWGPNAEDLKLIRDNLAFDASAFREIIQSQSFVSNFGNLKGDQLKTTPKGFDAGHPDIDLLRYKQFILVKKYTDEQVLAQGFPELVVQTFFQMRPFLDYMTEILTTDANGMDL